MKNRINTLIYTIITLVMISSCKKDELFTGKDNAIASFQLSKDDVVLKAAISPGKIVITAPEKMVLADAKPSIKLSEHASIQPDPSSIKDWDADHEFTITAQNGEQSGYTYSVERNVISKEGDVVLISQADVEEFARLKLDRINGSLTIGSTSGEEKITSIDALSELKSIAYDLTINPNYEGKDLSALKNLETVGSLQVASETNLETVALPKLKRVMLSMVINGAGVKTISFPELTNIEWGMQLVSLDIINSISFPKLQSVLENMKIEGAFGVNDAEQLDFPLLETIGGDFVTTRMSNVAFINFPKLLSVGTISVISLDELTSLSAPKLKTLKNTLLLNYNLKLSSLDLSLMETVGGNLRLETLSALTNVDGFKSLKTVGGEFVMYSMNGIKTLNGFKAMESVGTNVTIQGMEQLQSPYLDPLSNLKTVGGSVTIAQVPYKKFTGFGLKQVKSLSLFGYSSLIEEIDVRNLNVLESLSVSVMNNSVKVKGKDVFNASLSLESSGAELEGFSEVKDFTFRMDNNSKPVHTFPIRKITNKFTLGIYGFSKLSLPLLEEVSGAVSIIVSSTLELDLPVLKKTGAMTFSGTKMNYLSLPSMESIDGDFLVTMADYNGSIGDLKLPALSKINGKLRLAGVSTSYFNNKLTNLNGFAGLTEVKSIEINNNSAMFDFSGLKKAIASLPATGWVAVGNKYNPSHADLIAGKYIKP